MNKLEKFVLKTRIMLHRLNRSLTTFEDRKEARRRLREHREYLEHGAPHSSDEISYGFAKRDFIDAMVESNKRNDENRGYKQN